MSVVEAPAGNAAPGRRRTTRSLARRKPASPTSSSPRRCSSSWPSSLVPIFWNIALSFQDLRLVDLQNFNFFSTDVSLDNYRLVTGGNFRELLLRTFIYAFAGTTCALILGTWAALVVRSGVSAAGDSCVASCCSPTSCLPSPRRCCGGRCSTRSTASSTRGWRASAAEPVNFLLQRDGELFGFKVPLAFTVVVLFEGWRSFPFAFLFILARLQAMPKELEEAAIVDGATPLQRFRYVIMPELKVVFATIFLLRFIWTFNGFDEVYLLTAGAAGTELVSINVVNWLFGRLNVGAASALSIVLAATLGVTLAVYFKWFYPKEQAA